MIRRFCGQDPTSHAGALGCYSWDWGAHKLLKGDKLHNHRIRSGGSNWEGSTSASIPSRAGEPEEDGMDWQTKQIEAVSLWTLEDLPGLTISHLLS
jgi:hypothetical protein